MNKLILTGMTAALALSTLSLLPLSPTEANEKMIFGCNTGYDKVTSRRLPTTYVWYQGNKYALIRWEKALGGKTPQERCNEISPRFQKAYDNGSLSIITNSKMNRQPVICTVTETSRPCNTLLITLRPEDNPLAILNQLKDALSGRSVGPVRQNSGPPQVYYQIDLQEALRNAPVERE